MTTTLRSVFGDHANNRVSLTVPSHPSLANDGSGSDSEGDDVVVISGDGDGDGGGEHEAGDVMGREVGRWCVRAFARVYMRAH